MSHYPSPHQTRLYSLLLSSPQEDSLALLSELAQQEPWLEPALPQLQTTSLELWQAEHTRLFISGHPRTVCPPFESAYLEGRMYGTAVSELEDLYNRAGVDAPTMPADFLPTMLECSAHLVEQNNAELLQELWEKHLDRWLPHFAKDLLQYSDFVLYQLLGKALGDLYQ